MKNCHDRKSECGIYSALSIYAANENTGGINSALPNPNVRTILSIKCARNFALSTIAQQRKTVAQRLKLFPPIVTGRQGNELRRKSNCCNRFVLYFCRRTFGRTKLVFQFFSAHDKPALLLGSSRTGMSSKSL